ncbi:MAG: hypothetical protein OXE77_09035 [Flavobacteriaceae bacterium]|nr:hypothetical protein [Flavobacteriaceae bacterium]MCY4268295.1 hypothetical protein [Flavobacteriaceae bacterium]
MKNKYCDLFLELYAAKDEQEVDEVIFNYSEIFDDGENWNPFGQIESNFSVVNNQQSNPIAALIEKVTNSIDAILTKKCLELGLDPKSKDSPKSMKEAIEMFYPDNNWDLKEPRGKQAEEIQIIADGKGPRTKQKNYPTSVVIYDNGEGQHPEKFEETFLSLLRGNKNNIQFVQGKYNMGGSGAIVFCGKKRYQLIGSKRYDNKGNFGFTLIREHPKKESDNAKETWYEYLVIDNEIPSFPIEALDLNLENRKFKTGTIIKMYSYQLPKGHSGFAQELNQSINEFLYNPVLPLLTKDTPERFPNNEVLTNDLFGLRYRLYKERDDYIDESFNEKYQDSLFGEMDVWCFIFKQKVKNYDLKKTRQTIQKRYFKNNMSVLFSLNGQVHGRYTSEFITRSLKLNLLKDYLLIHVDCTKMDYSFRKELFMASRDRLKDGDETRDLRNYLSKKLSDPNGRLVKIQKERKHAISINTSAENNQLLKSIASNLHFPPELRKLLGDSFKLDLKDKRVRNRNRKKKNGKSTQPFLPERFPSYFKIDSAAKGKTEAVRIPLNGQKTIRFSTNCEDEYFNRVKEPGELKLELLKFSRDSSDTAHENEIPNEVSEVFNINTSSPNEGTIRINLNPRDEIKVGDEAQIKAKLTSPESLEGSFNVIFWVRISEPEKRIETGHNKKKEFDLMGLPNMILAYQKKRLENKNTIAWDEIPIATMENETVMVPQIDGTNLDAIYVNMDSTVLKKFKSKHKNPSQDQILTIEKKYYTSVYFHVLFLYTITQNRGYVIKRGNEQNDEKDVLLENYLMDLFEQNYASFILNYEMEELIKNMEE